MPQATTTTITRKQRAAVIAKVTSLFDNIEAGLHHLVQHTRQNEKTKTIQDALAKAQNNIIALKQHKKKLLSALNSCATISELAAIKTELYQLHSSITNWGSDLIYAFDEKVLSGPFSRALAEAILCIDKIIDPKKDFVDNIHGYLKNLEQISQQNIDGAQPADPTTAKFLDAVLFLNSYILVYSATQSQKQANPDDTGYRVSSHALIALQNNNLLTDALSHTIDTILKHLSSLRKNNQNKLLPLTGIATTQYEPALCAIMNIFEYASTAKIKQTQQAFNNHQQQLQQNFEILLSGLGSLQTQDNYDKELSAYIARQYAEFSTQLNQNPALFLKNREQYLQQSLDIVIKLNEVLCGASTWENAGRIICNLLIAAIPFIGIPILLFEKALRTDQTYTQWGFYFWRPELSLNASKTLATIESQPPLEETIFKAYERK